MIVVSKLREKEGGEERGLRRSDDLLSLSHGVELGVDFFRDAGPVLAFEHQHVADGRAGGLAAAANIVLRGYAFEVDIPASVGDLFGDDESLLFLLRLSLDGSLLCGGFGLFLRSGFSLFRAGLTGALSGGGNLIFDGDVSGIFHFSKEFIG